MTRCRFRADVDAPYEAIGRYQDLPMIQNTLGTPSKHTQARPRVFNTRGRCPCTWSELITTSLPLHQHFIDSTPPIHRTFSIAVHADPMITVERPMIHDDIEQSTRLRRRTFSLSNILLVAASVGILGASIAFRLPRLDIPNENYDEGVYLESLFLMHDGYLPFRDIVATQGPLHLYLAYPAYALGGNTLSAARSGSVATSLLGVLGTGIAAAALFGRWGGLGAALVLALSPTYLTVSRQALPEPMAIGLAAVAVACSALARQTGQMRWRVLAGATIGLACLVKPITVVALLPVVILAGTGRSLRTSAIAPVVTVVTGAAGVLAAGTRDSLNQVVGWRLSSGQVSLETIPHNAALLLDKMQAEHLAVYTLAIIGAAVLWRRDRLLFLAIAGWAGGALLLLLTYTELSGHLGATLLVPLALLAGMTMQATFAAERLSLTWPTLLLALPVAAWALVAVPSIAHQDYLISAGLTRADRTGPEDALQAASIIAAATEPRDMIVTDSPYLAFLANRRVPPGLVDPSSARIRAGAITDEQMIASLDTQDADVVVLWTGKLAHLDQFFATVEEEYTPVASFGTIDKGTPRAVYVRWEDPLTEADEMDTATTVDRP
jgi:hypothetical protein